MEMGQECKHTEKLLEQYRLAVDESSIFSKTDARGIITYVNDEFCRLSKYEADELIGKSHRIIRHPDNPRSLFEAMWKTISSGVIWKGIVKNLAKDGSDYYVSATIIPITDENGVIIEYLGIRHNVSEIFSKDQHIAQTRKDDITGLGSRVAFLEDIAMVETKSVVLVDIASFHDINDYYGHGAGDDLLREIGVELEGYFRAHFEYVTFYRLPIDIFALLFTKEVDVTKIEEHMQLFLEKFKLWPIEVKEMQIYAQAVAGMSVGHDDVVYQDADIALQYAKRNKNFFQLFNKELNMRKEMEKNFHISKLINHAIHHNQLLVHFQPIVNNQTMAYEKYEALVRIKDEDERIVSPGIFLDIAKKTGIYTRLTQEIIKKSIESFHKIEVCEFSINISFEDIIDTKNRAFLLDLVKDDAIASRLVLEITETEEVKDLMMVSDFFKALKSYGCKIAIDDFGSGYSNFKYLMEIQADYLKLDGSLIKNLTTDIASEEIVKAITSFSRRMGIKTIAEYVSTKEIFEKVRELGVDYSQGFYFSPPLAEPFLEN